MSENPFTMVSEKVGGNDGTVNAFAKADFQIFKKLFDYDFSPIEKALEINCFSVICNYEAVGKSEQIFNKSVSEKVQELSAAIEKADDEDALYRIVTDFYKKYGVGKFGLNKAFRVAGSEAEDILTPITNTGDMLLSDIIGYESQKQKLIEKTFILQWLRTLIFFQRLLFQVLKVLRQFLESMQNRTFLLYVLQSQFI